ncbi:MAG: hypothetical protein IPJ39_15765 [Saprospiraceae bacterium]|nr:hypothetical protein [Saprospiraceae bacterium]
MKTKFFSAFIALMFVVTLSQAQDYNKAIGLRLGYPNAISGKMFINDNAHLKEYWALDHLVALLILVLQLCIRFTSRLALSMD